MTLALARLRAVSEDPSVLGVADDLSLMLARFQREVRGLTYVLHPPGLEEVGLHAAVRALCTGLAERTGIRVSLQIHGADRRRGSSVEATAYRLVQEALINVQRHACASHVRVRLSDRQHTLFVVVKDDGVGLSYKADRVERDTQELGVGISGMIARVNEIGGRFVLRNRRHGSGTVVGASLPRQGRGQAFLTHGLDELRSLQNPDD